MKIMLDKGAVLPTKAHDADAGWYNCTCPICGKLFHRKPSVIKKYKTLCCSIECKNIAKSENMKGEGNHQYGLKGSKNASWKADIRVSRYGYIQERRIDHPFADKRGWVFQHRLIAEQYLLTEENSIEINGCKYLDPKFEVHHKNFNRKDNRPENLEVVTHGQHRILHNHLNPVKRNKLGQFEKTKPDLIKIKKVTETAILPKRMSIGAAGYDLYADIDKSIYIKPHETVMIQSNIAFEIPKGYYGAIYARSGLSVKSGLRPATCVSVIDSDYRGSVGLPIHNDSNIERIIQPYERVAQIVFQKALEVEFELVDDLAETERGDNGFGSSGR